MGISISITCYRHGSRHWSGSVEYTAISPGFRNDNGFFPRSNFRTVHLGGERVVRGGSDHWFSTLRVGPSYEVTTDQTGLLTDRSVAVSGTYRGGVSERTVSAL
ncbi:MAG: hypothetical protein R3281_06280 [Balneolaceae bacterium]|nr:hypothetical protein [Balneolaceae bacterium]